MQRVSYPDEDRYTESKEHFAAIVSANSARRSRGDMIVFSLTILLGAFLLFQVELIIGKCILPWFGGASAVWITCMLFFQVGLLGGYLYGHVLNRVRLPKQSLFHRLLLLASFLILLGQFLLWRSPLVLDASWKPQAHSNPLLQVLTLLAVSVGLPFLVLASTAPLLQSWWRRLYPQSSPYRLYAVSNFGSFLGLISYPFLIEPFLHLKTQANLWTWAYVAFGVGCSYCAWQAGRAPELGAAAAESLRAGASANASERPGATVLLLWLGLAACASAMFLATTNQLCKNVAPVPLLWVLPLALYLLTFMLCFESEGRYSRKWFQCAFAVAMFLAGFVMVSAGRPENLSLQVAIYCFVLFAGCMVCHGELARLKPDPSHLTMFYLVVAAGGTLGGIFVGLVAPFLFRGYWEYEISLWLVVFLILVVLLRDRDSWLYSMRIKSPLLLVGGATLLAESMACAIGTKQLLANSPFVIATTSALLLLHGKQKPMSERRRKFLLVSSCSLALLILAVTFMVLGKSTRLKVATVRNFYGALTVDHQNPTDPAREAYALEHGEIVHGFQFRAPGRRFIPTAYFTEDSGLGLAFAHRSLLGYSPSGPSPKNLRVGIIGLGIGTIAAYGRTGDYIRFYELNPAVVQLASDTRYFQYLEACPAQVDIVLGDGRLSLERELEQSGSQNFDILVVDAFSGDAVPVHLLTEEAFRLYVQHLRNSGSILAVQMTNSYLNLRPVAVAAAQKLGLASVWVHTDGDGQVSGTNDWVLLSRDQATIDSIALSAKHAMKLQVPEDRLWTDDYSNLLLAIAH